MRCLLSEIQWLQIESQVQYEFEVLVSRSLYSISKILCESHKSTDRDSLLWFEPQRVEKRFAFGRV